MVRSVRAGAALSAAAVFLGAAPAAKPASVRVDHHVHLHSPRRGVEG
ncbi:hypothetical protein U1708_03085 [Sphingomonas sp. ZB1N12]